MDYQIYKIGTLAYIDELLDELQEEFGDLPEQSEKTKAKTENALATVEETRDVIGDINEFVTKSRAVLVDLKQREDRLKQQQFNVQNNKEFDAITNEMAFIKREHSKLSEQMRKEALKLENLKVIQETQVKDYDTQKKDYEDKVKEIETIAKEQTSAIKKLTKKRKNILKQIDEKHIVRYDRIRTMHRDAATPIVRISCGGCFNALPAQQMVDVRNNLEYVYYCENCGRVLLPEDFDIDEEYLASL